MIGVREALDNVDVIVQLLVLFRLLHPEAELALETIVLVCLLVNKRVLSLAELRRQSFDLVKCQVEVLAQQIENEMNIHLYVPESVLSQISDSKVETVLLLVKLR